MSKYDNGLKYDFKIEDGGFTYDYKLYQLIINLFEGIYVNDDSKELVTYLLKTERMTLQDEILSMAFPSMTDSLRTTDADGLNLSVFIEHLESIGILQDFAYMLATIMLIENNLNVREEITSFVQVMLEEKSAIMEYVKSDLYSGTILNFVMNRYGKTTELTVKGSLELENNTFSNVNGDLTVYASNSSGTVTDSITYNDVTLNNIGEVYDYILDGDRYYNIGVRDYESGDEDLENVVTNGTITYYVRSETLVEPNGTKYMPYEDEFISAANTYLGLTDGLEIRGKTYQNLYLSDNIPTINHWGGVLGTDFTFTASNGNAEFTKIDGSEVTYTYIYFNFGHVKDILIKPNTTYTVVGTFTNIQTVSFRQPDGLNSISSDVNVSSGGYKKALLTTTDYDEVGSQLIYVYPSDINANTTFSVKNFMILEGDYTEIDLPTTITGIESVASPVIKSVGKNLFDFQYDNYAGAGIVTLSGSLTVNTDNPSNLQQSKYWIIRIKPSTVYNINTPDVSLFNSATLRIGLFSEYPVSGSIGTRYGSSSISYTFTSGENDKYLVYCMEFSGTENSRYDMKNIMIQELTSSTATAYEPYTTETIDLDGWVGRSLPDGTCDKRTMTEDTVNVAIKIFDGTESFTSGSIAFFFVAYDGYTVVSNFRNNKYSKVTAGRSTSYLQIGFTYEDTGTSDVTTFKAQLAKWYNDGDPLTVYYRLATPIVTPNELNELKTYEGTTHIFSENSNVEPEIYARILTVDEDRYTEINELELLESATTITSSGTTIQPNLSFYIETSDVELFALASLSERLGFTEVQDMILLLLKIFDNVGISDLDDPRTAVTDWYIGQDSSNDNRFNTWLVPFDMLVDPRQSDFNIMPPVEHTQIDLPYTDGSIFQDTKYTNRIFNLVSYSAQGLSTYQKEELKMQIVELLASTKDEPKKLTNLNNNLTFDVRYSGELGFEEAPSWIKATIPLETKPYGYKQFSEIISGDGIIVNDGHADLGVKVEISGGCVTPNFTIGGTEFTWDSTVPSDETLVIDNENKTCYLEDALGNKTQALKYLTDGTSFRTIPKGNQAVVQCLNDSTKSHLTIEYQPKYLWKGADLTDE